MTGFRFCFAGCCEDGRLDVQMFKNKQSVLPLLGDWRHSGAGVNAELVPVAVVNVLE